MDVDSLAKIVSEQQAVLDVVCRDLEDCREVCDVLVSCLSSCSALREESFLAGRHRRRFNAIRLQHPFQAEAKADALLDSRDIALSVGLFAGPAALRTISAVSNAIAAAVRGIWPVFRDLCPCYIYVCGGTPDGKRMLSSVERLSTATMSWEPLPPMVQRRGSASVAVVSGRLYVCGGCSDEGLPVNSVERFDPAVVGGDDGSQWEVLPPMFSAREGASAGSISGRVFVCGGWDDDNQTLRSCESFDPKTGLWYVVAPMIERRARSAASILHGRFFVCGGSDRDRRLNTVESFGLLDNGIDGEWIAEPAMLQTRFAASAAAADGHLFVCGGWGARMEHRKSVECLNVEAGAWEFSQPMQLGRPGAAAVAAAGFLYVLGGYTGEEHINAVERLDGAAASRGGLPGWKSLTPMTKRRSFAGAVVAAPI